MFKLYIMSGKIEDGSEYKVHLDLGKTIVGNNVGLFWLILI